MNTPKRLILAFFTLFTIAAPPAHGINFKKIMSSVRRLIEAHKKEIAFRNVAVTPSDAHKRGLLDFGHPFGERAYRVHPHVRQWDYNHWGDTKAAWAEAQRKNPITEILHVASWVDMRDPSGTMFTDHKRLLNELRSKLKSGVLNVPNNAYTVIIYRDKNGVHSRYYEPGHQILLPAIRTFNHGKHGRNGLFWCHQLEETGRGLVTFEIDTPTQRDLFIKVDSRGSVAHSALIHQSGYAYRHHDHYDILHFVWGGWGGSKSRLLTPFNSTFNIHENDLKVDGKHLRFPGNGKLWFALDHSGFYVGKGTPKTFAEANTNGNKIEFQKTGAFDNAGRWFGFAQYDNYHHTYKNIEGRYFAPTERYEATAGLQQHFVMWRPEWKLPKDSSGFISFSGHGNERYIALHDSIPEGLDSYHGTKFNYYVDMTKELGVRVFKQGKLLEVQNLLPGSSIASYANYWFAFMDGDITFGHGKVPGKNVIAHVSDPDPLPANYFSFSSSMAPVDYTDITITDWHGLTETIDRAGAYKWSDKQKFKQAGRGAVRFAIKNTGSGSANRAVKLALGNDTKDGTTPIYEFVWGADNNQAGQIFKNGQNVREQRELGADGAPLGAIDEDDAWHNLWISFDNGSLAYGKGDVVGNNVIDSWVDPNPQGSDIVGFGIGAESTSVSYRLNKVTQTDSAYRYEAKDLNLQYGQWAPSWHFSKTNKGGITFTAQTDGIIKAGLAVPGSRTVSRANYDITINDNGEAYVSKNSAKQSDSVVNLLDAQKPQKDAETGNLLPTPYWVLFNEGTIIVGTGSQENIGKTDSIILSWTDDEFDPETTAIKRYSFSAGTQPVIYDKITPLLLITVQERLDALSASLASKDEIEKKWLEDPTAQTVGALHAGQLFWHKDRMFEKDNHTSFSCKVKKVDRDPLDMIIGFSDTADNNFAAAKYTLSLKESGDLALYQAGNATPLATAKHDRITSLGNGRLHSLWINYDHGKISLGVDSPLGTNPVFYHEMTPAAGAEPMRYLAVGTGEVLTQYSEITFHRFYDPTTMTTSGNLSYDWKSEWQFLEPGKGTIEFTVQNTDDDKRPLILYVGLGGSTLPANENVHYNGAQYNVMMDYTGLTLVRRRKQDPNNADESGLSMKLGEARPSNSAHLDRIKALSDGAEHKCWLVFEDGWFTLGVDSPTGQDPVWTWNDPTPIPNIQHYSFDTLQSSATLTKITAQDAKDLRSLERAFSNMSMLLITNPAALLKPIDDAAMMRLFKGEEQRFIQILNTLKDNREIFTEEQRQSMARTIGNLTHEPSFAKYREELETISTALMAPIVLETLINEYSAMLPKILGLDGTDPARQLFFRKLQALSEIPTMQMQEPGIIQLIQTKLLTYQNDQLIEFETTDRDKALTSAELRIIGALQLRTTAEETIVNLQDPAYVLSKISEMADLNARVSTLAALLGARRANSENDEDEFLFVYKKSTDIEQYNAGSLPDLEDVVLKRLDEILAKRYMLDEQGKVNLEDTIKLARQTPGFSNSDKSTLLKEEEGENKEQSLGRGDRLDAMLQTARTKIAFDVRKQIVLDTVSPILSKQNNEPERIAFFIGLASLMSAPGSKSDLEKLETEVLTPLSDSILSSDMSQLATIERQVIEQVRATIATISNNQSTDLFALYAPNDILNNIEMLKAPGLRVATLVKLYGMYIEAEDPTTIIPNDQHGKLLSALQSVFTSRNELGARSKASFKKLLQDLNTVAAFADTLRTELPTMLEGLDTYVDFGDLLASAKEKLETILYQQDTPEREAYFNSLNTMVSAPGNKRDEDLEILLEQIIEPLEARSLSTTEKATLELIKVTIDQIRNAPSLWKRFDDPTEVLKEIVAEDIPTQLNDIEELLVRQMDEENNLRITQTDIADHDLFIKAVGQLVDRRDQMTLTERSRLATILKRANSTTPGLADAEQRMMYSGEHGTETIPQLLERLASRVSFTTMLKRVLTQIERTNGVPAEDNVTLKVSTDPERQAFFTALQSLLDAPGSKSNDNLQIIKEQVIEQFAAADKTEQEALIIEELKADVERLLTANNLWEQFGNPKEVLNGLQSKLLNVELSQQISDLEQLLVYQADDNNTDRLTAQSSAEHATFMTVVGILVDNRDELSGQDRTRLSTIIKRANSTAPGLSDAEQQLIYNGTNGPESLAQLLERLGAQVSFDTLLEKVLSQVERVNGVPAKNNVTLKLSSDPERIAFFNTLSQLLDAPGSKSTENLEALKEQVVRQFDAAEKTEAETATLSELAAGIESLLNTVDLWEQFGNPAEVLAGMADDELKVSFAQQLNDLEELLVYQANEDNDQRLTAQSASEHDLFMNVVGNLVDNRDQLSSSERSRLSALLKKANSTTPGLADASKQLRYNSDRGSETIPELLERLASEVSFALLKEKILKAVERIDGVPAKHNVTLKLSTDPERIAFFRTVGMLLDAAGSKPEQDLLTIQKEVIEQFDSAETTATEAATLDALADGIEKLMAKTNLWEQADGNAAFIITNVPSVIDLDDRVQLLQRLLLAQVDAEENERVAPENYQALLNHIGTIIDNRDELNNPDTLDELLRTFNSTPGIKDATLYYNGKTPTDLLTTIQEGIAFNIRVGKVVERIDTIIGMLSSSSERQEFFNYLGTLFDAPGNKDDMYLDSITTAVIEKVRTTKHTPQEAEVLQKMEDQIAFLRSNTDLFAKLTEPGAIAHHINDLLRPESRLETIIRLIDMQIDEPEDNLFIHTDKAGKRNDETKTLVLALGNLVANRDELSADERKRLKQVLAKCNTIERMRTAYAPIIASLSQTLEEPVPFTTRYNKLEAQVESIIVTTGTDDASQYRRKRFFDSCAQLLDSLVGVDLISPVDMKTYIANVEENIITPLAATPLSQNEQKVLVKLKEMSQELLTKSNTFRSHLRLAQLSKESLYNYAQALSDIFYKKTTGITFTDDDYSLFTQEVSYIVNNRELLLTNEASFVETMIRNAEISADFAAHKEALTSLREELNTDHPFGERIAYTAGEVQELLANSEETSIENPYLIDDKNYFFQRFLNKLYNIQNLGKTILDAPGMKTEEQFMRLESQVLSSLGSSDRLSDEVRERIDELLVTLREKKEQLLADQKTFQYHFDLAAEQEANSTVYISALKDIIYNQRQGKINFDFGDDEELLDAIIKLVDERDALDPSDVELLRTTMNYAMYSSVYEDRTLRNKLIAKNDELSEPIPLSTRVSNYISEIEDTESKLIFLDSNDPARAKFFAKLVRLRTAPELEQAEDLENVRALLQDIQTRIIDVLMPTASSNEKQALKSVSRFIESSTSQARTARYQLGIINRGVADLGQYALEVDRIMRGRDVTVKYDDGDDALMVAAISHVVNYRALLSDDDLAKVQNQLRNIIRRGTFKTYERQLKELQEELATVQDFADRIIQMSEELDRIVKRPSGKGVAAMTETEWIELLDSRLEGNRFGRLMTMLSSILDAPGTKTESDFLDLRSLMDRIEDLSRGEFSMPREHRETLTTLQTTLTPEKEAEIFEAQKRFTYHLAQADEHRDNLSVYTSSLKKIIENKRLGTVTFDPRDHETFVNRLALLTDERDAMSPEDLKSLQEAINYAYYSAGFNDNPAHKQTLLRLYNASKAEISFAQRIDQYVAMMTGQNADGTPVQKSDGSIAKPVLQMNSDEAGRMRFFKRIRNFSRTQKTVRLDDVIRLRDELLVPLQDAPTSPAEDEAITQLENFVKTTMTRASTYTYNELILLDAMVEAQKEAIKNPTKYAAVTIKGIQDIVNKRNAGLIVFQKADYPKVIMLTRQLISNRELFTPAQVGEAQAVIRLIQNGAGFTEFDKPVTGTDGEERPLFDELYKQAGTPEVFSDRVEKYKNRLSSISNQTTDSPDKQQFVMLVSTIFDAPGERTEASLNELESRVLTPIMHGPFTSEQREVVAPVQGALSFEKARLNSFDYRFEKALTSPTPQALHGSLSNILQSYDPTSQEGNRMVMTGDNFDAMLDVLRKEVLLRTPSTNASLMSLLQLFKAKKDAHTSAIAG